MGSNKTNVTTLTPTGLVVSALIAYVSYTNPALALVLNEPGAEGLLLTIVSAIVCTLIPERKP